MGGEIASFFVRLGTVFDSSGIKSAKSEISSLDDSIDSLKNGLIGLGGAAAVGTAIWKLVEFGDSAVDAFAAAESAERRLAVAMQGLGVYTEGTFAKTKSFAEEMQRTTGISSDQITEIQALLTTMGLYGSQLDRVIKASADLAVGRGIPLQTAAMLLGRAFEGNTQTLGRFGIKIDATGIIAKDFETVLHKVEEAVGGQAQAQMTTYAGKTQGLSSNFHTLMKDIGEQLLPTWTAWNETINKSVVFIDNLVKRFNLVKAGVAAVTGQMAPYIASLITANAHLDKETASIQKAGDALKKANDQVKPNRGPDEFTQALQKRREALTKIAQEYVAHVTQMESDVEKIKADYLEKQLQKAGLYHLKQQVMDAAALKIKKLQLDEMKSYSEKTFGALASFQNSKLKELAEAGKAAGIVNALVSTYVAYNEALANPPGPPWSYPIAAAALATGLANVATIAGLQLAEGGIVRATPGGVMATIGEGGQDEAVIPLGGTAGRKALAGLGQTIVKGTVNQTINFGQGGQDPRSPDLLELLDKIRLATKDGLAEALDAAKEIYETGKARAGEA